MGNIIDYIQWRGDITMEKSGFNDVDALIFTQLAYVPFPKCMFDRFDDGITIGEAADIFFEKNELTEEEKKTTLMTNTLRILAEMQHSKRFSGLKLIDYAEKYDVESTLQFGAVTVRIDRNTYFVAFRGTDDTITGWEEDFRLCYMTPVKAQIEAVRYLKDVCGRHYGKVYVGGHSKGGNLSVYSVMKQGKRIRGRVKTIYNFDGPGFLESVANSREYTDVLEKVRTYMPQNSVVGMIMYQKDDYTVVHSTNKGFMQHVVLSWELVGTEFITEPELSESSIIFNEACKKWVNEISPKDREQFIGTVFQVLRANNADTISDFTENIPASINASIKSFAGLDKTTKRMVKSVVMQIIRLATRTINEEKKSRIEEKKNKNDGKSELKRRQA